MNSATAEGLATEAAPWQLAVRPRAPTVEEKEEEKRSAGEGEELLIGYSERGDGSSSSASNRMGGGSQTSQTRPFVLPGYVTKMRQAL